MNHRCPDCQEIRETRPNGQCERCSEYSREYDEDVNFYSFEGFEEDFMP